MITGTREMLVAAALCVGAACSSTSPGSADTPGSTGISDVVAAAFVDAANMITADMYDVEYDRLDGEFYRRSDDGGRTPVDAEAQALLEESLERRLNGFCGRYVIDGRPRAWVIAAVINAWALQDETMIEPHSDEAVEAIHAKIVTNCELDFGDDFEYTSVVEVFDLVASGPDE